MSVLIKGMEMPKECFECIFFDETSNWCEMHDQHLHNQKDETGRAKWCPLVEVPTPHGRLIDGDDLHEKMYHEAFEVDSEMQKWDSGCWIRYKVFENCERDCPTVIESEE